MKRILVLKTRKDLRLLMRKLYPTLLSVDEYNEICHYNTLYAFKLVNRFSREGTINGGVAFCDGALVTDPKDLDYNPHNDCSTGLNIATLDWCKAHKGHWQHERIILKVKFTLDHICIPYRTDGKFRVKGCEVIGQVDKRGYRVNKEATGE